MHAICRLMNDGVGPGPSGRIEYGGAGRITYVSLRGGVIPVVVAPRDNDAGKSSRRQDVGGFSHGGE